MFLSLPPFSGLAYLESTSSVEDFSHPLPPLVSGNMISFPGLSGLEEATAPSYR